MMRGRSFLLLSLLLQQLLKLLEKETKQLLKLQLGMVRYGLIAAAVLIAFSAALGVAYFFAFVVA